jgi:hypothetical protein
LQLEGDHLPITAADSARNRAKHMTSGLIPDSAVDGKIDAERDVNLE